MTIDDLMAEIAAARAVLGPKITGLQHFLKLPQSTSTLAELNAALQAAQGRDNLLDLAEKALAALKADGFPARPPRQVSAEVLADLTRDRDEENAALADFTLPEAVGGMITIDPNPAT